jgi:hypothetical protein
VALAELRTRLQQITVANGFNTDAGDLVFLGERPALGPDDPAAAVAIVVGPDEPTFQGPKIILVLPVQVEAHVREDVADPWLQVEAVIEDIKTAVELDHDLGGRVNDLRRGSVTPLDREDGSTTVGAGIEYRLVIAEQWGTP